MQRISITIEDELKHKLDVRIPKGERASFVSKAISNELDALKKSEAITVLRNFKRFKVDKNSVAVIREIRKDRVGHMAERHSLDESSDQNSDDNTGSD